MSQLRYRLALDLGTTSLGWSMVRLNSENQPCAIIKAGVRIFSDGRNPKDGTSLAVNRRLARGARRRRDRLLMRKNRMMSLLVKHGFFPAESSTRKTFESLNPYELRAKGLDEALTAGEFARALFHINQRRGFKSNRKADKGNPESGVLKTAISSLRSQLNPNGEDGKARTVGELLWRRMQAGNGVRARYRERRIVGDDGKPLIDKSYDLYIDRAMIEAEFDALWEKQLALNPSNFTEQARLELKNCLISQRPLKSVRPGRCTFESEEERAPLALPSQQRFRIYQEVNNLRILNSDLRDFPITIEQRDLVANSLERNNKRTFAQIKKNLKLASAIQFNLEDDRRRELKGNSSSATLSKEEYFGEDWFGWSLGRQDEIVMRILTEENEASLIQWLQTEFAFDEKRAEAIANLELAEGYGSLSIKALKKILPALQSELITYDKAALKAGYEHHSKLSSHGAIPGVTFDTGVECVNPVSGEIQTFHAHQELPYYGEYLQRYVSFGTGKLGDSPEKRYGKIANPTVHAGLNQVRTVVNALIKRYGHPSEVIVELARNLKASRKHQTEQLKKQAENQRRNDRLRILASQLLSISPERVKSADIQKLILWEGLSFGAETPVCPYSGAKISMSMVLTEAVEIDHILPFSQTLDDSLNNKTLATRHANRVKGNRAPFQAREYFEREGWGYGDILQRAERMPRSKRYRFAVDGYEQWLQKEKSFLDRALNDTSHLSRIAAAYLKLICPQNTRVIPGQMTALLRKKFGLNNILGLHGEKNRNDHRHHAVDACVIAITDQSMLQRFAQASASAREKQLDRLTEAMTPPWPTYREQVTHAIHNIWVSYKPDHGYEGAMMEETAYGIQKDGSIKQKINKNGAAAREIKNLIRIADPTQLERHGVDSRGDPLPYKGYLGGSNYCIEIVRNEAGKWEGEIISTFEAYQVVRRHGEGRLRQPGLSISNKPLVMRLVKGDTVRMLIDGKDRVMRMVKVSGRGQIWFAPVNEANVDARNRDVADPFAYISKMATSLQSVKARRITISPIGQLRDPGFSS